MAVVGLWKIEDIYMMSPIDEGCNNLCTEPTSASSDKNFQDSSQPFLDNCMARLG